MLGMKKEAYFLYEPSAVIDTRFIEAWTLNMEAEGMHPVSYIIESMNETETGAFIQDVCLVRIREKWRGAMKRFIRKYEKEDTGRKYNGLAVYG